MVHACTKQTGFACSGCSYQAGTGQAWTVQQLSWVVLCRQIEASLHLLDISMDGNTVRVEGARPDERVISDNVLEDVQKAHPATMPQAASLHSNPPVCEDTIERQEADALAARLVYKDAEVMVELVAQADFKPDTLNLTGQPMAGLSLCCPVMHSAIGSFAVLLCPPGILTSAPG
jgi:hypothetical protein